MRLQSLNHLIEIVRAVTRPKRVEILGSASLLPGHPELGVPGGPLERTTDADFLIDPISDALAESLQFAAGRDSAFMAENGYYADILRPEMAEALPAGWQSRLHSVPGYDNVFALDAYDLALVKLMVGREKDLDLLRAMLRLGIVEPARLRQHYQQTPLGEREAMDAGRNLNAVLKELGAS
ncbi:MAG: hypothetical protein L0Z50_11350 [Verrucomicrobiales bacterium]|nr:hypothetical protein [Verrucomicrobiales bacterium]